MEDWDFDKMVEEHGREYMIDQGSEYEPYDMSEFNEMTNYRDDPLEAITRAFYGGKYGFENDSFNPNDEWFAYDAYGNLVSISDYEMVEYFKDHIDEEEFHAWCVAEGYCEPGEEDEE